MDFCRWLGADTPQQQAQCEEVLEWVSNPLKKAAELYEEGINPAKDTFTLRIPSIFDPLPVCEAEEPEEIEKEPKKGFGIDDFIQLGGKLLAAPPIRMAWEMGKSGFENLEKGLQFLGIDLNPEHLRARAVGRAERMKNIPVERITLLQAELNEKINSGLEKSSQGWVKNLNVELKDGSIIITGKVDLGITDVDLVGEIQFEVKNGDAEGKVIKLEAGGFSIPDRLKEKITEALKSYGVDVPQRPNFNDLSWLEVDGLQNLTIQNGQLILDVR